MEEPECQVTFVRDYPIAGRAGQAGNDHNFPEPKRTRERERETEINGRKVSLPATSSLQRTTSKLLKLLLLLLLMLLLIIVWNGIGGMVPAGGSRDTRAKISHLAGKKKVPLSISIWTHYG